MDELSLAIAATPIAAYLLMLGGINTRSKPLCVSGASDLATLALALSGVAFVGPIALFRPEAATAELGNFVWLLLMCLYWIWVTLLVMLCRPRLVIYNLTAPELRPILSDAIRQLDPAARWAGDAVSLPTIGVQAHLEGVRWTRNTSLVATGRGQDPEGWRRFSHAVQRAVRGAAGPPNRIGPLLLAIGGCVLFGVIACLASDPTGVAVEWKELFSFGDVKNA